MATTYKVEPRPDGEVAILRNGQVIAVGKKNDLLIRMQSRIDVLEYRLLTQSLEEFPG